MRYLFWLFLILAPVSAVADPADALFVEGVGELAAGRFDGAIDVWERVYKLKPSPKVLYSMANAAGLAGRPEQAIQFINKMNSNHSVEEIGPFKQKSMASLAAFRRQSKAINFAKNIKEIQIVERERLREESKMLETWTWMGWAGTTMTLLGGAGVAAAVYLDNGTAERLDALKSSKNVNEYDDRFDDFNSHQTNQQIALFGGVSLIAVGVALIVWDLSTTTESYSVDLAFHGNQVGGNFVWTF